MSTPLDALNEIIFQSYSVPDDVWRHDSIHVEGLHAEANGEIAHLYKQLRAGHPVDNVVIEGRQGVGKTHFLGQLRAKVMSAGDLFVLIQLASARYFWASVVDHYMSAFARQYETGQTQLAAWSAALFAAAGLCEAKCGRAARSLMFADEIAALRPLIRTHIGKTPEARRALDVLVAVLLQATENDDFQARDIGTSFLQGVDLDAESQRRFGFATPSLPPRMVISAIDLLTARAGKVTVVCVDQLDGLVAVTAREAAGDSPEVLLLNHVANGLMDLAEDCPKSLIVLSCFHDTWMLISNKAVDSAVARFPVLLRFHNVPTAEVGRSLIGAYFRSSYRRAGFSPPYGTWPILPSAFDEAQYYSPRELIRVVADHVRSCCRKGVITELAAFQGVESRKESSEAPTAGISAPIADAELRKLDEDYEAARNLARVHAALDQKTVDTALPALLQAGLRAWVEENAVGENFRVDGLPDRNPAIHARLRQILIADIEDEAHWSLRAVLGTHPRAALNQLRRAINESGLGLSAAKRHLVVLRNEAWSAGPETKKALAELECLGGRWRPLAKADLVVFSALAALKESYGEAMIPWLRVRRPASSTSLLAEVLRGLGVEASLHSSLSASPPIVPAAAPAAGGSTASIIHSPAARPATNAAEPATIQLGVSPDTGRPIALRLEDLRRHTAIFAGPGSGKTVFLRRIIEECALAGVSSIVLDPNNDLARLGLAWPEPQSDWREGDSERARRYLAETDVVIWTPRRTTGRALSFQPLGDLAAVVDDPEALALAIDNAVATLVPRAGLPRTGSKAVKGQAVLSEALQQFVRDDGTGLKAFLGYLGNLPADVSSLADGVELAHDMSQTLRAATVVDPLFGGDGAPIDPGVLLTPTKGKRARVSVISLIGLPNDDQRQSFVNALQMALFAWVKRNPAGDRPLGGLYVMDEAQTFAPASPATACSQSTRALAAQARKYGLGLVFATQAPKGIHNQIVGSAATHVYGFLNASAHIAAVRELAQAKGGDVPDIGRLTPGKFYVASERIALQKITTANCLSYHPKSPLTEAEVMVLATGG